MNSPDQNPDTGKPATPTAGKQLLRLVYVAGGTLLAFLMCCCLLSTAIVESTGLLLFGWFFLIRRLSSEIELHIPAIVLGMLMLMSFIGLVSYGWNWIWQRQSVRQSSQSKWNGARCALAAVLAFTAGLSFVGVVSATGWLLTTDERLVGSFGARNVARRAQSRNNLKHQGLGFWSYEEKHQRLPPGGLFDRAGRPMQSWQTYLLPYMEQQLLYDKLHLDQPWYSPVNDSFVATRISYWLIPGMNMEPGHKLAPAPTYYEANLRVFGPNSSYTSSEIKDGIANTISSGEVISNIRPWANPRNLRDPAIGLNVPGGYGSPWPGGVQFGFMDGSVRFVSDKISPEVLRALSTPSGGEPERLYNME